MSKHGRGPAARQRRGSYRIREGSGAAQPIHPLRGECRDAPSASRRCSGARRPDFKPGVKLFACRGDRIDNQGG